MTELQDTSARPDAAEVTRPSPQADLIPSLLARRGVRLETKGFIALAPAGLDLNRYPKTRIQAGTASTHASDAREAIGAYYNAKNPKAGWKEAKRLGWLIKPCTIQVQL